MRRALEGPVLDIIAAVKEALEETPPELASDISERGILLAGGGVLLRGFAERIERETNVPVVVADSPLTCVALGAGQALDEIELLERTSSGSRSIVDAPAPLSALPSPWPRTEPTAAQRAAYADATVQPFWLDDLPATDDGAAAGRAVEADLCIVGGGFTGLWAALHAKERDPGRDVVVLEADTCGYGASGRNGGFLLSSLTHGLENGLARFADEMEALERLGFENYAGPAPRPGSPRDRLRLRGDAATCPWRSSRTSWPT